MRHPLAVLAVTATCFIHLSPSSFAQGDADQPAGEFSRAVVDIGIVVEDLEKSAKFYSEVLGLKEVQGFSVPAEKATSFGLTNRQPATVRVFVLDEQAGKPRTSLKLMAFPDAPGKKQDQAFIHSTIGVSYLTLFVTDMERAVARLKEAKVELLGETPASLGGNNYLTAFRDPDGNFIELIGPMK